MNNKQRKLLNSIISNSAKSNTEWRQIESLLLSINCKVIEGNGSQVKFIKNDIHLSLHRPHPNKEALRYRIKLVKDFLIKIGVKNEI